MDAGEWRRVDNNTKAKLGKSRFLEFVPGAIDASSELVRRWLEERGLETSTREWVEVTVLPDVGPRFLNVAFTTRCIDAFLRQLESERLTGVELKISGGDGVCGLTLSEERLLRAGHILALAVNPLRGRIGEMDPTALLEVPRRLDGIPVGRATLEWDR